MKPLLSVKSLKSLQPVLVLLLALAAASGGAAARDGDRYHVVEYPPSAAPGELQFGVTYTLWVPRGVKRIRGVIVHQHGCGSGACKGGATAAYDLHWQALARKWDCALMGPSYHQEDAQNCRLWCDPRHGSEASFLRSLHDLAAASGHPEIERAPWCLWGHSGGGFWASLMQTRHPERIAAIWFRSGTAFSTWESGAIPKPEIPAAAMRIPMMCNPGAKERDDARFRGAWTGTMAMFHAYRAQGAPIGFAPDPRTSHECGDSRYLAIPFFDACLAMRLPDRPDRPLKPVGEARAYLAPLLGTEAKPAAELSGEARRAVWLPNRQVARAWEQYVRTGATEDTTPPPAPSDLRATSTASGVELAWEAAADFESGLQGFVILRDGKELVRLPEKPSGRFGRPLFQAMSYHDTPEKPLPELRFTDTTAVAQGAPGEKYGYTVVAVNSAGLQSAPSRKADVKK